MSSAARPPPLGYHHAHGNEAKEGGEASRATARERAIARPKRPRMVVITREIQDTCQGTCMVTSRYNKTLTKDLEPGTILLWGGA